MKTQADTVRENGTIIKDEVLYNSEPPPSALIKVMNHYWAGKFLALGLMRFGSLESYRQWENPVLGDLCDGKGMFLMKDHPYNVGSSFPVYAWCASKLGITPERVLILASQVDEYDCLVRIHQPLILIQRVKNALLSKHRKLRPLCAEISYNRGLEVGKETLNSQKLHFNIFQKEPKFTEDSEYRISLRDIDPKNQLKNYIDLEVGDCSDIMNIEGLPTNKMRGRW